MPIDIVAEQPFRIGIPTVIKGPALDGPFVVVFEDDGETGYFYAMDSSKEQPFQDGVMIYSLKSAEDKPYVAQIGWSPDSKKAILLINGYPNAVFDFELKQGCCRTGYPPMLGPGWSPRGHTWDDAMLQAFAGPVTQPEKTVWTDLVPSIGEMFGIDTSFEDHHEFLVVDTSPVTFLENPERIEPLFEKIRELLPAGAVMQFFNVEHRIALVLAQSQDVISRVAAERGYVAN